MPSPNLEPVPIKRYTTFKEFWPFYLSQHQNPATRYLHVFGVFLALCVVAFAIYQQHYALLWLAIVAGYFPAWVAHFFIEKNRPATFTYPIYSFMGDMKMIWQTITRRGL